MNWVVFKENRKDGQGNFFEEEIILNSDRIVKIYTYGEFYCIVLTDGPPIYICEENYNLFKKLVSYQGYDWTKKRGEEIETPPPPPEKEKP